MIRNIPQLIAYLQEKCPGYEVRRYGNSYVIMEFPHPSKPFRILLSKIARSASEPSYWKVFVKDHPGLPDGHIPMRVNINRSTGDHVAAIASRALDEVYAALYSPTPQQA